MTEKKPLVIHVHTWKCTRAICGIGPSREMLIRDTLARKAARMAAAPGPQEPEESEP